MSILLNRDSKVIVQGITGRDGGFHASKMKSWGTKVVGGVSPGKGGLVHDSIPVFNTVSEAVSETGASVSVIFVPAPFVKDAIMEAASVKLKLIVVITEGVPTLDFIAARHYALAMGSTIIGPNCPGIITPGESLVGIMPGNIFTPGKTGVISRSGTLTYEVVYNLTQNGIGQSTAVGIGGDPVSGIYFNELLQMFENDPDTNSIVMIGEIGGDAEESAARYIKEHISKPVFSFIAGVSAPADKRMGHAGAIISSGSGSAQEKIDALQKAGVVVAADPAHIPHNIKEALG